MIDLSTRYLGFGLKNPLVVSSSPLTENIDNIRQMEDAGAAAIVLHSLFEEQIFMEQTQSKYLEHIRKTKEAVSIPVIASLNATYTGSWVSYAKKMQQAGADAIELNIYYLPTDPEVSGVEIENRYLDTIWDVTANISIPIAVKLNPYFSSISNMAQRLDEAGADGLVLFNRFYMPDFDLENLDVVPHLTLSNSSELLLRLHWAAILFGNIEADIAVTGGVHTAKDMIKCIMAGASVTMMTSALLKFGIHHIAEVLSDLEFWLEEHGYESILLVRGVMSRKSVTNATVHDRVNYMKVLSSYVPRFS
ncbi:dihydroorotate dehydrogenase-like protein [bacterium]|nr:dihydroorotate dehydrogenase-like protein [bacterium]